jgi:hypothetical protein
MVPRYLLFFTEEPFFSRAADFSDQAGLKILIRAGNTELFEGRNTADEAFAECQALYGGGGGGGGGGAGYGLSILLEHTL